jgi:hypothetical protein
MQADTTVSAFLFPHTPYQHQPQHSNTYYMCFSIRRQEFPSRFILVCLLRLHDKRVPSGTGIKRNNLPRQGMCLWPATGEKHSAGLLNHGNGKKKSYLGKDQQKDNANQHGNPKGKNATEDGIHRHILSHAADYEHVNTYRRGNEAHFHN